eukprot:9158013-Pyramimonas_sp.AAC.1
MSFGSRRTAKDGDDFAVHMLAHVGGGAFQLYLDCQSTLNVPCGGSGTGTEAWAPRGHVWAPFWA